MTIKFTDLDKEMQKIFMYGDTRTEEKKYEDSLKAAYVKINKEDLRFKSVLVSNIDKKAYEHGIYYSTIKPLKEIKYYEFERWFSGMDF